MAIDNAQPTPARINPTTTLCKDSRAFSDFMKSRMATLQQVAASHMDPKRLFRIVLANVSRTPQLQNCSIDSVFRATMQAAELGLEPGSAVGEAYLVPYGKECTLIPGYRGLIALAFRSGKVASVQAQVVYQGDEFEPPTDPFNPKMYHALKETNHDPARITFAYCVVKLKDGGLLYDVMTRSDIDRVRQMSKAGNSGPWVQHYAEMARKTVTRRCLKYAPMSIEMSKAIALDDAADTGDSSILAEFESIDFETGEVGEPESKTSKVNNRIPEVPEDKFADETTEAETQGALV